jgi:uncharacterized protein YbjQ (UPF0145 family)
MKTKIAAVLLPLAIVMASSPAATAAGRDDLLTFRVADVLNNPTYAAKLPAGVRYYFGGQSVSVVKSLGTTNTNKKTNAFNKTDQGACEWAMLSALIAIGEDAKSRGGNAVIHIKSNYKGNLTSSNDSYVCGAGGLMAGVALVGDVATVR